MRKRIIRRIRKNVMRLGKITRVKALNRDDDGTKWPKKDCGYVVDCIVNGWRITSVDDSWYGAWQGALECAKWASEKPSFVQSEKDEKECCDVIQT